MPRTYGKAKQTRLSFAPIALPTDDDDNDEMARQATLKYGHPSRPTVQATRSKLNIGSGRKGSPDPFVDDKSTENDEVPTEEGSRKSRRKKDKKDKKAGNEKDKVKVKNKNEKNEKKKDKKKKRNEKKEKKEKKSRNPTPPLSETPEIIPPAEESSDSDLEIQSSVRKNRAVKRKRSPSPEESNAQSPTRAGPSAQEENDEEGVVARPRRKLRRGPAQPATIVLDGSSGESDAPIASSPVKRGHRNMSVEEPQTPRRNRNQDQLDLEEDLEDLQDSVVKQSRTRGRLANSARAQRQKHLETLRRRRAGQTETDEEQSESKPDETELTEDDSSEAEDEEEEAVRQPRIPFAREDSDVESEIASNEDLDRYDKDFVLDDDDDKLGVPAGLEEMPIEFSRHSYKQLKDYFQDAVEWMVLNQLFPAFPRSSPIYKVAFDKLEDEVKGRTGSQLISSVWNADFCRALMARPHLEETTFPISEDHPCDACKRSGHPASADLKFYGKAYSLDTLEPLSDPDEEQSDDDDEEEEEDDGLERDRDGHVLPDENTRFYLGRHCKGRATMAHTLTHWRFHLNEWVVDHLARMGHVSDEKVLARTHWSQKRKAKYAGEAFRDMVEGGEVKKLWRDFHINLRTARESTTLG